MSYLRQKAAVLVSLVPALLIQNADALAAAKTKSARASVSKSAYGAPAAAAQSDSQAIKAQLDELSRATRQGDSKALAALWSERCLFVDEDGLKTLGRANLESRFAEVFANRGKPLVDIVAETIDFPAANVASVGGSVIRREDNSPATRFTMVLTKEAGRWTISQAMETPVRARTPEDRLRELNWLLGSWSAEKGSDKVSFNAEMTPKKSFIICTYRMQRDGKEDQIDKQIIGWDPIKEQFVSWIFDSNGGFGYGTWSRKGNQWVVESSGIQQDGSTTKAVNVLSVKDPNSFSWQSTNRSVDGIALGDTENLEVMRLK